MNIELLLLVVTILLTSLSAGVFFGYAVSVNWALHLLTDREYVKTMQNINKVIENPLFLSAFMLPLILLPVVTFMYGGDMSSAKFMLFAGATILYVIGMFGVTMVGNIPLNEQIKKFNLGDASEQETESMRKRYEMPWNRFHTLRTWAGILSVILLTWAALI